MNWGKTLLILGLMVTATWLVFGCGSGKVTNTGQPDQLQGQQGSNQPKGTDYTFISSNEKENCSSCHRKETERDFTVIKLIVQINGHDQLSDPTLVGCLGCHGEAAGEIAFKKIMHRMHLLLDNESFSKKYNGACVDCHKVASTGDMFLNEMVPSGVKLAIIEMAMVDAADDGCASCHKKTDEDHDLSLEVEIAKLNSHIKLNDPDVNTCISCHDNKAGDISFKRVLHKRHLLAEHFIEYGNSCLNCHIVTATGEIKIKGL
ncbi:MAG: multiheme c-type cytochrome [Bacillota bacterium]